jgi:hypothetical protein
MLLNAMATASICELEEVADTLKGRTSLCTQPSTSMFDSSSDPEKSLKSSTEIRLASAMPDGW